MTGSVQAPRSSPSRMSMARNSSYALDPREADTSPVSSPTISQAKAKAYGLEGLSDSAEASPLELGQDSPSSSDWRRSSNAAAASQQSPSQSRPSRVSLWKEEVKQPISPGKRASTRASVNQAGVAMAQMQQPASPSKRQSMRTPVRPGPGEQGPSPNDEENYAIFLTPPPAGADNLGNHSTPSLVGAAPPGGFSPSKQRGRQSELPKQLHKPPRTVGTQSESVKTFAQRSRLEPPL
mmetsp:Transcript_146351/g.270097  ORF Transcript_146351/g.270097 Transcript_146351/m.270097 type:complete len:237 (-) Transcript_146351:257-967(-)